jgi:hypothetical protein
MIIIKINLDYYSSNRRHCLLLYDLAYIYDGKEFVTATKTEVIMELIDNYVEPYKKCNFL